MANNDDHAQYGTRIDASSLGAVDRGSRGGPASDEAPVKSVDRAITVLEILAQQGEAGVTEIAGELGVHKSTAFRLVGALERRGLVEQPGSRGKYQLGFGVIRLAGAMTAGLDLTQQSRRVCEDLASELGETVNIAIPSGEWAVNIDQVRGASAIVSQNWIGRQCPLHATSSGKVLLAYMSVHDQRRVLRGPLESVTEYTITDPDVIRSQIDNLHTNGHIAAVEELEIGLNAVAAPVRGVAGDVIAAISAAGPSYRMTVDSLEEIGRRVAKAGAEISTRMGHMETSS